MKRTTRAILIAAMLAGVSSMAITPASATYAVEMHTVTGAVQTVDTSASTLTVNGLTIRTSSQTGFRGIAGLYEISQGMTVTIKYYNQPGTKSSGVAVEIDVAPAGKTR
ncbi:MAG TPA: DUF5666 domain-containing protein [Gammaproteobacteria bacterium]|nr:DUF5666 domain-containing protein [Gammaproteobacteria bacterium]